jgi:hypothetical protein
MKKNLKENVYSRLLRIENKTDKENKKYRFSVGKKDKAYSAQRAANIKMGAADELMRASWRRPRLAPRGDVILKPSLSNYHYDVFKDAERAFSKAYDLYKHSELQQNRDQLKMDIANDRLASEMGRLGPIRRTILTKRKRNSR